MTPAMDELHAALMEEIKSKGEARNISRIVDARCTLPRQYAYVIIKYQHAAWGLHRCKSGRELVLTIGGCNENSK